MPAFIITTNTVGLLYAAWKSRMAECRCLTAVLPESSRTVMAFCRRRWQMAEKAAVDCVKTTTCMCGSRERSALRSSIRAEILPSA